MTIKKSDIKDEFGSGGANMSPSGGSGQPSMRDVIRELLGTKELPYFDFVVTAAINPATDALLAAFANGVSTTPGTQLSNSKAVTVRWNNDAAPGNIAVTRELPADLDITQPIVVRALVSKSGATSGDATKLTIGAFFQSVGALHDADTDHGGDSDALVGTLAAKTVSLLSLSITPPAIVLPAALTLTVKPKAGTLGTDDLFLHTLFATYTRK